MVTQIERVRVKDREMVTQIERVRVKEKERWLHR